MGWKQRVIYGKSGRDMGYGLGKKRVINLRGLETTSNLCEEREGYGLWVGWKQRSGKDMCYGLEKVSNLWEEC